MASSRRGRRRCSTPYEDDTSTGLPEWESDQLEAFTAEADRRGWQLEIHAIGDAGIRMVLDAYERLAAANEPRDRRHRVEHIETIARADIPRFAELGVVASMQPYHADPSPNQIDVWAGNIGKERAGQAWSWASIRKAGGVVALGSDWPVVPFDPMLALNSAVNRQTKEGQPPGGWLPSEKLSLPEALAAYGHGSAYAAHADQARGTLRPGALADLIVLDRDILAHRTVVDHRHEGGPDRRRRPGRPSLGGAVVKHFIVGAIAAAIAFYGLTRFLPQFVDYTGSIEGLIVLGIIFGVVNGLIGPIVKTLALPLSLLTMGLVGILVNAGLLLLVAIIAQQTGFDLMIGDFPPDLLTADTIVAAVIGSTVIGLVTGVVNAVVP